MFDQNGDDLGADHTLQPNEMVLVTTEDVFNLPPHVTTFVSCKTTMTHQGVWAITVGIVDPCWVGPISTTLVNFSAQPRKLVRGMPFLRATFFTHTAGTDKRCPDPDKATRAYMIKAQQMSVGFNQTFLDQKGVAKEAGAEAFKKMRDGALGWAAFVAVVFTLAQLVSVAMDRYVFAPSLLQAVSEQNDGLVARIEALETQVSGPADQN
jgi:deoxycytidine triphosphate deaminase